MSDDARSHGTVGQNAELVGAAAIDFAFDSPIWAVNKIFGTKIDAPTDLASEVYSEQTQGQWGDLTPNQVEQASQQSEDQGAVIDATEQTASDISEDPLSPLKKGLGPTLDLVPWYVWILVAVAAFLAIAFYAAPLLRVVKG